MSSKLYKNDLFVNHNIPFIFNNHIYEYDMKDAGFSLTKEFHLLSDDEIKKLNKYKKQTRTIELGKIQIKNTKYKTLLKEAFVAARQTFFEKNKLEDNDIISVKKDAIFTTKECEYNMFGDNILFRVKNTYSSYIQLKKNLELYYNYEKLDIKGMSDDNIAYHKDYMIDFIKKFFNKMETESKIEVIDFTKRFIDKYKRKELDIGYYRSFDSHSSFKLLDVSDMEFMDMDNSKLDEIDISYNFYNILLKLIQIPI